MTSRQRNAGRQPGAANFFGLAKDQLPLLLPEAVWQSC